MNPTEDPLAPVASWPVDHAAVAVVTAVDTRAEGGTQGGGPELVAATGDLDRPFALASVTKLLTAHAVLVAIEEGSVQLDQPAGPDGATLRHLLAHASGIGPEGGVLAAPGSRRIYSNAGYEAAAELVAGATGLSFERYLREAVLEPLAMDATRLDGSPAHGATSTATDLARYAADLLAPTTLARETVADATSVQVPGLDGVLPGFGPQSPCDWGLGPELRDGKSPHWTGATNSPATFGHFGRSGTALWVDPDAGVACVVLTDRPFGPWAAHAWPALADDVLRDLAPG